MRGIERIFMAKDLIDVDGKAVIVREDTAKAYRGVKWAATVAIVCLAIIMLVAIGFLLSASRDGKLVSPADSTNSSGR